MPCVVLTVQRLRLRLTWTSYVSLLCLTECLRQSLAFRNFTPAFTTVRGHLPLRQNQNADMEALRPVQLRAQ